MSDLDDSARLDLLEAARKRPGMYVGTTGQRGRLAMLREVMSYALGLALAGQAKHLAVTLKSDGSVEVADDGPGVPLELNERGAPVPGSLLTSRADDAISTNHAKTHLAVGAGIFVACALSDSFEIRTHRSEARWVQRFFRGTAVSDPRPLDEECTGTTIVFRPDPELFTSEPIDSVAVTSLLRDLASLVPGLETSLVVEGCHWKAGAPSDLLGRFQDPVVLEASDGDDRVTLGLAIDRLGDGRSTGRWFVNLRELTESNVLRRCVNDAFAEALGGGLEGTTHVVVNAQLTEPEFSGATRTLCHDPRLLMLVRRALIEGVPKIDAAEGWLRLAR